MSPPFFLRITSINVFTSAIPKHEKWHFLYPAYIFLGRMSVKERFSPVVQGLLSFRFSNTIRISKLPVIKKVKGN